MSIMQNIKLLRKQKVKTLQLEQQREHIEKINSPYSRDDLLSTLEISAQNECIFYLLNYKIYKHI